MLTETILARGHENILSTNRTTLEITKEEHLSKKGDCIIAVAADKAIADLSSDFKERLCRENGRLIILIEADGTSETINAIGDPFLILTHPTDIVVRKSRYISDRTLAIQADKAACDLSRRLVEKLQNPKQKVKITLSAGI